MAGAPGLFLSADPLLRYEDEDAAPRQRFSLEDTGFDEVPPKYRRFYRRWRGRGMRLHPTR